MSRNTQNETRHSNQTETLVPGMRNGNGTYLSRARPIAGASLEVLTTPWVSWNSIYRDWRKTRAWWHGTRWASWTLTPSNVVLEGDLVKRRRASLGALRLSLQISPTWMEISRSYGHCYGNLNIRDLKILGWPFFNKGRSFFGGLLFSFLWYM